MSSTSYRSLVLIALLVPTVANAYYVETRGETVEPMRYADGDETTADTVDVEFRMNTSTFPAGDGIADAVRAAFATWAAADCTSIDFAEGAASTSVALDHWTADGDDHHILVFFTDSAAEWTGGPAVGHFYFGFNPAGEVLGGTIVLNSRDHAWATDGGIGALDVQSIVTALIGRSLGITSAMEGNATYPVYQPGNTDKRVLGTDDIAAIQHLYLGTGCAAPVAPEEVCDGLNLPGEEECPPRPVTMPGDGGTIMPGEDAGMANDPDAGMTAGDAGMGGGDGGCSCRAGATRAPSAAMLGVLFVVGAVITRLRRRRSP
jgi:MYXO-CTERM domain-containing protein